jgi:hypothetical protein
MTLDKGSWGFRRNTKLSDVYTMEEFIKLLVQTVRYRLLPFKKNNFNVESVSDLSIQRPILYQLSYPDKTR